MKGKPTRMKIHAKRGRLSQEPSEATLIGHFEGEKDLGKAARRVDRALAAQVKELIKSGEFAGKHQQLSLIHARTRAHTKRILMVGLGKRKDCSLEKIRQAMS